MISAYEQIGQEKELVGVAELLNDAMVALSESNLSENFASKAAVTELVMTEAILAISWECSVAWIEI